MESTEAIRKWLLDRGASPDTADALAADFIDRANRACQKDRRYLRAATLLPLGYKIAAERLGCSYASVYVWAEKHSRKAAKG